MVDGVVIVTALVVEESLQVAPPGRFTISICMLWRQLRNLSAEVTLSRTSRWLEGKRRYLQLIRPVVVLLLNRSQGYTVDADFGRQSSR